MNSEPISNQGFASKTSECPRPSSAARRTSRVSKFYERSIEERLEFVKEFADLSDEEINLLKSSPDQNTSDKIIENVIGNYSLPIGIAVNFQINDKDYLIPMVLEEPSVVAAASNAAKLARECGGFTTSADDPVMIGQIHVFDSKHPNVVQHILAKKEELLSVANSKDPMMIERGGGAKDLDVKIINDNHIRIHLYVDCRDAMGANAVNTMVEAIAPLITDEIGGKAVLKIISNMADRRLVRAECTFSRDLLGDDTIDLIHKGQLAAEADSYRAATHNKGIMNAISAICVATGNDWRAVEAGAHAFAGRGEGYNPLTKYQILNHGDLLASIELPLAVATVGGSTKLPQARVNQKIIGAQTSQELAQVMAAAGLAQNFAALKAITTEGIQKGHMRLHERKN
ncbi:MAG: hydroxymethylglutaryl-CoA reductase, degradative [Candidatus Undinarchaeales archaeon]|jgi:hydroxymethylglutaryl-CoA reductase|nr:hydroxymethylglutaryl-CoA reductase, degradative [Candidatus Undinarchaeales archaeon]